MTRYFQMLILMPLALAFPARADTVNWGGSFGAVNVQSNGDALTATFTFEIGTFGAAFVPDETNVTLWSANWQVLDAATYNAAQGFFTDSFEILDHPSLPGLTVSNSPDADPVNFAFGEQVYIWIYNVDTKTPTSEWVLITDSDGLNGDDWLIPDPGDQQVDPVQWRVSTAMNVVFGGLNDVTGPGERTGGPPAFDLQTHTFVPEPSAALLFVSGVGALLLRRRRFR